MSESTNSLNSVSDKITENNASCSSLSQASESQTSESINANNDTNNQLQNLDSNSETSESSVINISPQLDEETSNRTSKSNTGSWTLVDAKEFSSKFTGEESHTGVSKGQGQISQGQGQNLKPESDSKQGKLLSTFSNLKKMKFGKRQISMPGSLLASQKATENAVYCTKCKMVRFLCTK